ncbi:hypothetical protein [Bacteroides sp.]|nr:hypothetical protein [Bacteroides sp.]
MKKNQKQVMETLNEKEQKDVMGGYAPLTKEQQEKMREQFGLLADIICT